MDNTVFTIFDTETTGFDAKVGHKIIEIAAIQIQNGKIIEGKVFDELIDPKRDVPFDSSQVNGITTDMLVGKPTIDIILPKFMDFVEGSVLVAHNAEFDMGFLDEALFETNPFGYLPTAICTKLLSRKLFPQEKFHNLDTISYRLGIPYDTTSRHRALADVELLAKVFLKLVEIGKYTNLGEILAVAKER